jgi:hypothetical protein
MELSKHAIGRSPYLLYIIRKSLHNCFPASYTDPDTGAGDSTAIEWNPSPQNKIVMFFTRIGGSQMMPRMFFEISQLYTEDQLRKMNAEDDEDEDDDEEDDYEPYALKILNMCSTHLSPIGLERKREFAKSALNLWVTENNKDYTIKADIYNSDIRDPAREQAVNRLLYIFTAQDGGRLLVKDATFMGDHGILYELELPEGSLN